MEKIAITLGLKSDATEKDILAAIDKIQTATSASQTDKNEKLAQKMANEYFKENKTIPFVFVAVKNNRMFVFFKESDARNFGKYTKYENNGKQ